jgi:hypothetical protein
MSITLRRRERRPDVAPALISPSSIVRRPRLAAPEAPPTDSPSVSMPVAEFRRKPVALLRAEKSDRMDPRRALRDAEGTCERSEGSVPGGSRSAKLTPPLRRSSCGEVASTGPPRKKSMKLARRLCGLAEKLANSVRGPDGASLAPSSGPAAWSWPGGAEPGAKPTERRPTVGPALSGGRPREEREPPDLAPLPEASSGGAACSLLPWPQPEMPSVCRMDVRRARGLRAALSCRLTAEAGASRDALPLPGLLASPGCKGRVAPSVPASGCVRMLGARGRRSLCPLWAEPERSSAGTSSAASVLLDGCRVSSAA